LSGFSQESDLGRSTTASARDFYFTTATTAIVVLEEAAQQAAVALAATTTVFTVVTLLATSARIGLAADRFGLAANRGRLAANGFGFTTGGLGGAATVSMAVANPHTVQQLEGVRSLGAADKNQQGRGERANQNTTCHLVGSLKSQSSPRRRADLTVLASRPRRYLVRAPDSKF
jgi:hypothetical protein